MHPFDILELNNGAKFIFTPCPGTKDTSISKAFDTLVEAGADAVITLLSNDELKALSVTTFGSEAATKASTGISCPLKTTASQKNLLKSRWQIPKMSTG